LNSDSSLLFQYCLQTTSVDGFHPPYRGKVRDVYSLPNERLAIVVTDRISAFDHVMREPIPFKGQILNLLAAYAMEKVSDIIPTHILNIPHPNVTIARKCDPLPVEVVVRGYLAGHAWRVYQAGERALCGVMMPDGMRQNEAFPTPIITPTTKAKEGHDEDISAEHILEQNLLSESIWKQVVEKAQALFKRGSEIARERGLILVDTKYEFGLFEDELILIDEIHTPDSSRFFYAEGYEHNLKNNKQPEQLSKEFLREWLIKRHFMGKENQELPTLPDSFRQEIYFKYSELYHLLTGESFTPVYTPNFDTVLKDILFQASK